MTGVALFDARWSFCRESEAFFGSALEIEARPPSQPGFEGTVFRSAELYRVGRSRCGPAQKNTSGCLLCLHPDTHTHTDPHRPAIDRTVFQERLDTIVADTERSILLLSDPERPHIDLSDQLEKFTRSADSTVKSLQLSPAIKVLRWSSARSRSSSPDGHRSMAERSSMAEVRSNLRPCSEGSSDP